MTDITNIPLNKLTAWKGNVRKTRTKGFIDQLAASIKAHGLQQNLIVKKDGKQFSVVAGGQRLKALQQLAAAGEIKATHPVPCKVTESGTDATELQPHQQAPDPRSDTGSQWQAECARLGKAQEERACDRGRA